MAIKMMHPETNQLEFVKVKKIKFYKRDNSKSYFIQFPDGYYDKYDYDDMLEFNHDDDLSKCFKQLKKRNLVEEK